MIFVCMTGKGGPQSARDHRMQVLFLKCYYCWLKHLKTKSLVSFMTLRLGLCLQIKNFPFAVFFPVTMSNSENLGSWWTSNYQLLRKQERYTRNKPLATSVYHHYKEDHPSSHLTFEAFKDETAKLALGTTLTKRRKHHENRFYNVESINTCVQSDKQVESTNKSEIGTKICKMYLK